MDDVTLENLLMYQRATPLYDDEKDTWDYSKDACNPANIERGAAEEEEETVYKNR